MLYDSSSSNHLKPWLVRTLEPICDAEPGALADYILALLKHSVPEPEMRKELEAQLDEFLEKECKPFVDTLFTVLRTKSYLPYASPPPPPYNLKQLDTGIPIPLDMLSPTPPTASDRSLKRSIEDDDRDGRPVKGPRLGGGDGGLGRFGGRDGRWNGRGSGHYDGAYGGGPSPMDGRRNQGYRPPEQKRGICRDYHNNGYCARGAHCKYSHGEDAVVPNPFFMGASSVPGGLPFLPIFPGLVPFAAAAAAAAAYDPHEALMDMRPAQNRAQSRAPILPRIQAEDGSQVTSHPHLFGELPVIQDLTPNPQNSEGSTTAQNLQSTFENGAGGTPFLMGGQYFQQQQHSEDTEMGSMEGHLGNNNDRGSGFSDRGRGKGKRFGDAQKFRPERKNDKTLVVEKIPEDKLLLERVSEWFQRFGTVTNVAIDRPSCKALVSFATHEEAHAAWKAEDAVFNNRFVKIFWHRPLEGHGQVGARALAASAPLVATMTARSAQPSTITPTNVSAPVAQKKASTSVLAAKQKLLEEQIAEQKQLMATLDTAPSVEEKRHIMAKLRKLAEEMKPSSTPDPVVPQPTAEEKEKMRLDKELEGGNASAEPEEETTEALKAKLAKLKAEAASLGITEAPTPYSPYSGGYRPYRGRGRGAPRSSFRGAIRGGPPRSSMKLDNRSRRLLLKGVMDGSVQTIRGWYEVGGQMEVFEVQEGGNIAISFKSRAAAEQAMAKGINIPDVGSVQISWLTNKPAPVASTPAASDQEDKSEDTTNTSEGHDLHHDDHNEISGRLSPRMEEEVVNSGWGGDDEDGMGGI